MVILFSCSHVNGNTHAQPPAMYLLVCMCDSSRHIASCPLNLHLAAHHRGLLQQAERVEAKEEDTSSGRQCCRLDETLWFWGLLYRCIGVSPPPHVKELPFPVAARAGSNSDIIFCSRPRQMPMTLVQLPRARLLLCFLGGVGGGGKRNAESPPRGISPGLRLTHLLDCRVIHRLRLTTTRRTGPLNHLHKSDNPPRHCQRYAIPAPPAFSFPQSCNRTHRDVSSLPGILPGEHHHSPQPILPYPLPGLDQSVTSSKRQRPI